MRFSDELRNSVGEWCVVRGKYRGIIRAVHGGGQRVTVQREEDNSTEVVEFNDVQLEGEE